MGTSENLKINKQFLKQIIANCIDGMPNEACGIIAAKDNTVEKVFAITNAENSPKTYRLESREHFKAIKEIDLNDWVIAGFYHSHVESQAIPSAVDLKLAAYPDAYYFIVSLETIDDPVIKAFHINNEGYDELKYEVIE